MLEYSVDVSSTQYPVPSAKCKIDTLCQLINLLTVLIETVKCINYTCVFLLAFRKNSPNLYLS
jgi:hypothetical protein